MAQTTWTVPISSEGEVAFPEELIKAMGWEDGTVLEWEFKTDGTIAIKKSNSDVANTAPPE